MNRRKIGEDKERLAADYLKKQGYEILDTNFYSRFGELDLIAKEGDCLVFCEVKYRTKEAFGMPEEAVTAKKLYRMRKTAEYYCIKNAVPEEAKKRFDVVGIQGEAITLYQNVTGF